MFLLQSLLLGLMLLVNVRITNGWEGESAANFLLKINGPLERIRKRVERDLSNNLMDNRVNKSISGGCQPVILERHQRSRVTVKCNGVTNFTISLIQIPSHLVSKVTVIEVTNSSIENLDLDQFASFPSLRNLSVTHSGLSSVSGSIPETLTSLNLSHNNLRNVTNLLFGNNKTNPDDSKGIKNVLPALEAVTSSLVHETTEGPVDVKLSDGDKESNKATNDSGTHSQLQVIDLSHNKITELPKSIFYLTGLQSLRISGNELRCEFVWEKLWEWSEAIRENPESLLLDANQTFCGAFRNVRVFQYTIGEMLQARTDMEEACSSVDMSLCSRCSLYALQKEGHPITHPTTNGDGNKYKNGNGARISISLKLDCSRRNLTHMPPVPHQTWLLNISHNHIKDLSPLKLPMYSNILILDAKFNQVNLDSLTGTPFISNYNYLNIANNKFKTIPSSILTSLKSMEGQGITFLGENYIDCDCNSVKELKPLFIENSKRIKDFANVFCRDGTGDGRTHFTRVKDLHFSDVCPPESSDSDDFSTELYLYLLIFGEVVLIVLIIAKVWHDQRTFRRTGILPWCSAKMPRLPCDAMLETIKEPLNLNRHGGSAASTSFQPSNNPSVSHIQLKDMRSSGSCVAGGSLSSNPSNQPHFSGSSRTSSV